jgi:hypothetical protein
MSISPLHMIYQQMRGADGPDPAVFVLTMLFKLKKDARLRPPKPISGPSQPTMIVTDTIDQLLQAIMNDRTSMSPGELIFGAMTLGHWMAGEPDIAKKLGAYSRMRAGGKHGGKKRGAGIRIVNQIIQDEIRGDIERLGRKRKGISYVATQAANKHSLSVGRVRSWINRGVFGDKRRFLAP